jgi:biopolymer transport protein ExbD
VDLWDLFHVERMELERGLSGHQIRHARARGELRDDDLVRPAGSTVPWSRLDEIPELLAAPAAEPPRQPGPDQAAVDQLPDFEEVQPGLEEIVPPPANHQPTLLPDSLSSSDVAFPVFEADVKQHPPLSPLPAGAAPPAAAWGWDDDDDDQDEAEDDDDLVIEDLEDIEILADDSAVVEPRKPQGGAGVKFASDRELQEHPAGPETHRPGRTARSEKHGTWGLSSEDVDLNSKPESRSSHVALPVVPSRDRAEAVEFDGSDDDPDASFSLSRSATQRIEELDLAPMVDVAFQLVLFFMVTATTVLYKTLEIPKPSAEPPPSAVAQGRSRSLDDLKDDYILVEIDDQGAMKLDREPIEPLMETLVEQLRTAREKTGRKSMLLSGDFATLHRNAVLALDAANEIGLGIAVAKPKPPQGPAPTLRPANPARPKPGAAAS